MKGSVSWWNDDRGYGCFTAPGIPGDVFAHRNDFLDIPHDSPLIETEPVEFEIGETQGRKQAVQIRRLTPELDKRFSGVVKNFDRKRGTGWIARYRDSDIFIHWTDIIDSRKIKFLAPEEEVEFSIGHDKTGRIRAIFVTHDTRPVMMQFADLNDFQTHLNTLAKMAEPEAWTFKPHQHGDLSVLNHYVLNTFRRARYETRRLDKEKVIFRDPGSAMAQACFNTGLVTPLDEPIYGYFVANRSRDHRAPHWWFEDFCVRSDLKLSGFDHLPERISFVTRPAEFVFDWRLDLRLRKDHISTRLERLSPRAIEELERRGVELMEAIDLAKDDALRRVSRDYKTAVPQFYRGEVQLLLPLCLVTRKRADVALVVERHDEAYFGNTILTLEQAYFNARLIAKPDSDWLRAAAEDASVTAEIITETDGGETSEEDNQSAAAERVLLEENDDETGEDLPIAVSAKETRVQ